MKYELGFVIINGFKHEAMIFEDGTAELGPTAQRKHREAVK